MRRVSGRPGSRRAARPSARALQRPLAALLAGLLAGVALLGCTPLYVPLVPSDMLTPLPTFRVSADARLDHVRDGEGGRLVLHLRAEEVPDAGWLAVQWFGPSGPERASESLWLEPEDVGEPRTLASPDHLRLSSGEWRAVLSWKGRLVRQVRITLP